MTYWRITCWLMTSLSIAESSTRTLKICLLLVGRVGARQPLQSKRGIVIWIAVQGLKGWDKKIILRIYIMTITTAWFIQRRTNQSTRCVMSRKARIHRCIDAWMNGYIHTCIHLFMHDACSISVKLTYHLLLRPCSDRKCFQICPLNNLVGAVFYIFLWKGAHRGVGICHLGNKTEGGDSTVQGFSFFLHNKSLKLRDSVSQPRLALTDEVRSI